MKTLLITIIGLVIRRLDEALNVKVRKPRSDKGQPRTEAP